MHRFRRLYFLLECIALNPGPGHVQAVQRSEKARLALLDTGALQAARLQHMTWRLVKAFHLLRSMFTTGPRVRSLQQVWASKPLLWLSP